MAGKILESLILSCFNSYIKHRKLIPCVQTGFREGMSTSINLKRMYNKIYTRSVHATYPDPTIMIFFDTKKFSTVSGMLGFCMKPLARAFRLSLSGSSSWLTGRTLQVRIGQTLKKKGTATIWSTPRLCSCSVYMELFHWRYPYYHKPAQ